MINRFALSFLCIELDRNVRFGVMLFYILLLIIIIFFVKQQWTIKRKKRSHKGRGLATCRRRKIDAMIAVELRSPG